MAMKNIETKWSVGKDKPVDLDSRSAGDPVKHAQEIAADQFKKKQKTKVEIDLSSDEDAASNDAAVNNGAMSQAEQLAIGTSIF